MADYTFVAEYCPLLPGKVDTLRRIYKILENIGLISTLKIANHVYFTPSQMLRDWGTVFDSEFARAEKNPQTAEKNPVEAEKNPQTTLLYNNINNNYNNINKAENEFSALFPESVDVKKTEKLRGTSEPRRCLFANSRFAKFEDFEKCFDKPEFADVDICYYYHAVADWSAANGAKKNDWISTARNFIRGDREKGKLHLKSQAGNVLGMNYDEAILALKEIDEL